MVSSLFCVELAANGARTWVHVSIGSEYFSKVQQLSGCGVLTLYNCRHCTDCGFVMQFLHWK